MCYASALYEDSLEYVTYLAAVFEPKKNSTDR